MTTDIFKLFKNSIELVEIKKTKRGTFSGASVYTQTLEAVVKRRDGMSEAINNSEDRDTGTTIHFRPLDKQYIEEGNFVKIDGSWKVIERWVDGKNFHKGSNEFIKVYLGDQIEDSSSEPNWS